MIWTKMTIFLTLKKRRTSKRFLNSTSNRKNPKRLKSHPTTTLKKLVELVFLTIDDFLSSVFSTRHCITSTSKPFSRAISVSFPTGMIMNEDVFESNNSLQSSSLFLQYNLRERAEVIRCGLRFLSVFLF